MTSFRVWHFSKDGLLLEMFGEPPKGWKLPKPRRALEKGKPASWDAGSTLFTDCFRLGPYLLVQFMRIKEEGKREPGLQIWKGSRLLGTLPVKIDGVSSQGVIYSISGKTLYELKLRPVL